MEAEVPPAPLAGAQLTSGPLTIGEFAALPAADATLERFLQQFLPIDNRGTTDGARTSVPRHQLALLHSVEEGSKIFCAVAFSNTALFRAILTGLKAQFQERLRQSTLFRLVELEAEVEAAQALVRQVAAMPRDRRGILELLKVTQLTFESFTAFLSFLEVEEPQRGYARPYLLQLMGAMEGNRELLGPRGAFEVTDELAFSLGLSQLG